MVRHQSTGKVRLFAAVERVIEMLLEGPLPHRRNLGVVDLNLISGECGARSAQQHDQACCHCLHGEMFTFRELASVMSALPPKADIGSPSRNVRFVPKADIVLLYPTTWSVHCDHGGLRNLEIHTDYN